MRIDKIRAINFFGHCNTEIDLTELQSPILLSGSNGSGKSSIGIEAISYALFGSVRVNNVDDAIRNEEDSMSVSIEFQLNGQNICITRAKRRGKSQKLQLIIDNTEIEELLSELQKRIDKLISLSPDSLQSSIFLRQEDTGFFAKAKPETRKQIISDILDLQQYERLEKLARDKRSELKASIKSKQASIENIEDVDVKQLEEDLIQITKILKKNTSKLQIFEENLNELKEYNANILEKQKHRDSIIANNLTLEKRITNNKTNIESSEEDLVQLKSKLKTITAEDAEPLQQVVDSFQNNLNEISEKGSELKEQHTKIIKTKIKEQTLVVQGLINESQVHLVNLKNKQTSLDKLNKLKEADCPTCLREMNTKELSAMKKSFQDEIDAIQSDVDKSKKPLTKAEELLEKISEGDFCEAISIQEKITKLQKQYSETKNSLKEAQEALQLALKNQKVVIETKEKIKSKTTDILKYKEDIEFLETQRKEVPKVKEELKDESEIKENIRKTKEQQHEGITIKAKIEGNIENALKEKEKREKAINDINKSTSDLELLEQLVVAFSKNGIPASIIETILPEIQDNANFYLSKMSEEGLEFKFTTIETLKNGDEKNTLDLSVFDGQTWRCFDSLSGGESFRVSLAIRLALSQILARRAGIELETLILDEPAVALDQQGLQSFIYVVKSLKDIFPRILITTHIASLADEFESKIQFDKTPSGTVIV